jgi:hypothetical protein
MPDGEDEDAEIKRMGLSEDDDDDDEIEKED